MKTNMSTAVCRAIWSWITKRASLVAVVALLGIAGCSTMRSAPQTTPAISAKRNGLFDVREARKSLLGKSPQLVVRVIGDPDRQAAGGHWEWWTYENRFHDSVTQRTIPQVTLVFRNGALMDITY
jgi:hypothetical protein